MNLSEIRSDLRYAVRALSGSRGYSAAVVLTLAVGIGANTIVFSLVNPFFFRALPFEDADRLVQVRRVEDGTGETQGLSPAIAADLATRARVVEDLALYRGGVVSLDGDDGPERVDVGFVGTNIFAVLGVEAALGRTFLPEEGEAEAPVVVVDHGLWQRRWGGDPELVGRSVRIDGVARTVIGVTPPAFDFPYRIIGMWIPVDTRPTASARASSGFSAVLRLSEGTTVDEAERELGAVQSALAREWPDIDGRYDAIRLVPIRQALNFAYEVLQVLLGGLWVGVAIVLLIACANVAGLTLARASRRGPELAVRTALGAGRGRIVAQLVSESLLLAVTGGLLGTALAYVGIRFISPRIPDVFFRSGDFTVDVRVLAFTVLITLGTPVAFGLLPAWRLGRVEPASTLRAGGRGGGGGGLVGRRSLVAVELAVAVVLVSAAGLTVRSTRALEGVDTGYADQSVLVVEMTPERATYPSDERVGQFWDGAVRSIAALPSVGAVGQVDPLPLNHTTLSVRWADPANEPPDPGGWPRATRSTVDTGYFESMGVPLLSGRPFDRTDGSDTPPRVVLSRSMAAVAFPAQDVRGAVGRSLALRLGTERILATVVGVVEDAAHDGIASDAREHVYLSQTQFGTRSRFLTVRAASGDPESLTRSVGEALRSVDPAVAARIRPYREVVLENVYPYRFGSLLLGAFGGVGILLAALGVFALVSYSVSSRARELGVRIAVGATAGQIRRLVVREGLFLALIGGGVGIAISILLAGFARSVLYGVGPVDPVTFGGVVALFLTIAVGGSLLPAIRATQVDPVSTLRNE